MMQSWIVDIVMALLGGLNIYQFVFWRIQRDKYRAEADSVQTDARQKRTDLMQDQYDYVFSQLGKLQNEYMELQEKVRREANEHSDVIMTKCNEIAELKSKVVYYKGLRCYRSDCGIRISVNPKGQGNAQQ